MNRDTVLDYPNDDMPDEYELTPGPEMEARIIDLASVSQKEDNWGVFIDRAMEDIEDHDLSLEDCIQIWDMGIGAWFNSR